MTLGLKNNLATETFSNDSDDVSVGEHVDLAVGTFRSRVKSSNLSGKSRFVFVFNVLNVGSVVAQEETKSTDTSARPTHWVRRPQLGCLKT